MVGLAYSYQRAGKLRPALGILLQAVKITKQLDDTMPRCLDYIVAVNVLTALVLQ